MQNNHFLSRLIIVPLLAAGLVFSAFNDIHGQETSAGGSKPEAQGQEFTSGEIDPCVLVTGTEAAEALGVADVQMERPGAANIPLQLGTCVFSAGENIFFLVMVGYGQNVAESAAEFENMRKSYTETLRVVDVPGIGGQAYWIEELRQLLVLKGTLQLAVSGNISFEKAREIAGKAAERLP
jgi:hypothetical protein